ncbi:MAG: sialidase family protein [Pseudomonadota bacterium]
MNHNPSLSRLLSKPVLALGLSCAAVAAVLAPLPNAIHFNTSGQAAFGCPAGYDLRDPVALAREFRPALTERAAAMIRSRYGAEACVWKKLPESFLEVGSQQQSRLETLGEVPAGLMRRAVEQKASLMARQKAVANADGKWLEYGKGSQIFDATYEASSGNDGIYDVMGRVDDFTYDPVNKRLFAAVGNGGIWMSEAVGGDVATLGDLWKPAHGTGATGLPTLVTSAVEWTPAAGGANGRLIALTGEHTQGGNSYIGLGAYYSDDLGATWKHSTGVPDGAFSFVLAVDQSNPMLVYAATGKGLYRSADAGVSFTNVALPVSDTCAGNITNPVCGFANFVTGLVVKTPEGDADPDCATGCPVVASVGYRAGTLPYSDGTPQAPGNGIYKSANGAPGSFERITNFAPDATLPVGLPPQDRLGRIEMGGTTGADQDKNFIYALIQDARLFNGTSGPVLDSDLNQGAQLPIECSELPDGDPRFVCELTAEGVSPTSFNGVFVSGDFGETWTRMADDAELLATSPVNGSSLSTTAALGVGPGVQSWYDQWIAVDPTQADPVTGAPTRIAFGLEEIWTNAANAPQDGTAQAAGAADFKVIGTYFAGKTCAFLIGNLGDPGTPACPTSSTQVSDMRVTTHPDQQGAIFIPDDAGGVWLFAGHDGGVNKQYSASPITDPFSNDDWAPANTGFYTLLNYGIAVAKDGTVWYGLQDNTSGKILADDSRQQIRIYIGDGMWTAVDPDNSNIAYYQTPGLSLNKTTDGGVSTNAADDFDVGTAHFLGPFHMDDSDAQHLVAVGTKVAVTLNGADSWTTVYDLGANADAGGALFQARTRPLDIHDAFIYAGSCAPCNLVGSANQFRNKISTNVGGAEAPAKGSPAGWHDAAMAGLPNRFIYNIHIDRADPTGKTIYVVLGGYSPARWAGVGQFGDTNTNVQQGKNVWVSKDAGETFTSIQGNLPDVISTYILKRGSQLIVATDVGVFISSDLNGTEWTPLGDHPNLPVNQMVLKPGDDTQLFSGTFGRGVLQYTFKAGGSTPVPPTLPPVISAPPVGGASSAGSEGRFGGGALGLPMLVSLLSLVLLRRRRSH